MSNKKTEIISGRVSNDELKEIKKKLLNDEGVQVIKIGKFVREATLKAHVIFNDPELEKYRIFTAAQIGNNMNQIARRLNQDNKAGKICEATYENILGLLEKTYDKLNDLLEPIR
jgi:hypothetical protein